MQNLWFFVSISAAVIAVVAALIAVERTATCFKLSSDLSATIAGWKSCGRKLDEVVEAVSELNARYENLRSRVGMREVRAARDEKNNVDNLSGAAWKDATRRKLWPTLVPAAKPKE